MDLSLRSASKKRKFNSSYEEAFLVMETPMGSTCLLCDASFSDNRQFNFKRHYDNFHPDFEKLFPVGSKLRAKEIDSLKSKSRKLKSVESSNVVNCDVSASTAVSYRVSHLIIKSGKPFTDGELIKNAFTILSEEFFNETEVKSKFETAIHNISLSARTVVRRLGSMNENLLEQLADDIKRCTHFSLQLDGSTDVTDTVQINVFIRLVFGDMSCKEELFDTLLLKGTSREEDVYKLFKNSLMKHEDSLKKLVAITTNGAGATLGKNMDLVSLCKEDPDFPPLASFHCLIHQVSLSAKAVKMDHVVTIVVKIVNSIKARPLQHRLFRKILQEETELKHVDLALHSEVRWLSIGKVLHQFLKLLPHIREFLKSINESYEQLEDPKWLLDLHFLVDLTHELNLLNSSLQGKDHTAWRLLGYISTFQYKLTLWIDHFKQNKIFPTSFPNLQKCMRLKKNIVISAESFVPYLQTLLDNFATRFEDWKDVRAFKDFLTSILDIEKLDLHQILQSLMNLDPSIDGGRLTNEILNLQTDEQIRTCVNVKSDLNIWIVMKETEYPTLLSTYKRMFSVFGTTYLCESSFSTMKNLKSRYRSQMSDEHSVQVMRMCTSTYEPDVEKLVKNSQCHPSRN